MLGHPMLPLRSFTCVWRCCAIRACTQAQHSIASAAGFDEGMHSLGDQPADLAVVPLSISAGLMCGALCSIGYSSTDDCISGLLMASLNVMLRLKGLPQCRNRRMSGTTRSTECSSADRGRCLCRGSPACLMHTEGLKTRRPRCDLGHRGCSIPRCCQQLPHRCSSRMLDTG